MKTAFKLLALLALGLGVGAAFGQAIPLSGQVINQYGVPLPYAQVRFCSVTSTGTPCTPTVPTYYDYGLSEPTGSPVTTDQYGNYSVYGGVLSSPNIYVVQFSPDSGITWSYLINGPSLVSPETIICGGTCSNGSLPMFLSATSVGNTPSDYGLTTPNTFTFHPTGNFNVNAGGLTATLSGGFTVTTTANVVFSATEGFAIASSEGIDLSDNSSSGIALATEGNFTESSVDFDINSSGTASITGTAGLNLSTGGQLNVNATLVDVASPVTAPLFNATTGFQINGTAASNHVLLGNGTDYVDSATIPYSIIAGGGTGPFAAAGVPCATSTIASTVCTSAQIVAALNTSPSTTLSTSLLPTVGTAGTYAYPSSVTTDVYGRVTAITASGGITPPTCNSNGCYSIAAGGLITEWGSISLTANSSTYYTTTITLPHAMTTNVSFPLPSIVGTFSTDPTTPPCIALTSTSLSGASVYMARCIIAGAGGGQFDQNFVLQWTATGY